VTKPSQTPILNNDSAIESLVDAMAKLSGLHVDPAYRDGVETHLKAIASAAKHVLAFETKDDAEPGPVFRP